MLNTLVEQGFVQELEGEGEIRYQPRLAARRGRQLTEDIWQALRPDSGQALSENGKSPARDGLETGFLQRAREALLGKRGRYLLSVAPVAAVFVLTEWLLLTGEESFAEPLSFLGVIVISLLGGTFPVLLLIASRRKGEVAPGVVYRFLGHPLVTTGIYLLFLASLFLHGLVIWENPVQRAAALAVGLLMVGATTAMARRGAFASRVVVELREDQRGRGLCPESRRAQPQGRAAFAITVGGQPATAEVRLGYADGEQRVRAATAEIPTFSALHYATFQLPATDARELKVWAHQITPEGNSEGLPALLQVHCGGEKKEFDLKLSAGQVVLLLDGAACRLELTFKQN